MYGHATTSLCVQVIQLPATGSVLVDEEGDNLNAPTAVPSEFITNSLFSLTKGESAYDGEVHLGKIQRARMFMEAL